MLKTRRVKNVPRALHLVRVQETERAVIVTVGQHLHAVDLTTSNKSLTGSVSRISQSYRIDGTASGVFTKGSNGNARLYGNSGGEASCGGFNMDASHDHTVIGNTGNTGSTSNSNETRPRNIAMMYIIKT